MNKITRTLDTGYRKLAIDSPRVDKDTRTVTLVWSTGAKGLRSGWDGPFYEELSMDPQHVDLKRLQSGNTPLLASHDANSLNSVIGVVERAWIENGKGMAKVRFSEDPDADRIYQKVKEGVLRNVSIGYQIRKMEDVTRKGDKYPTFRAVDYEINEISIVPVGFDSEAFIQRNKDKFQQTEVTILQEEKMSENKNEKLNETQKERERIKAIQTAVRSAKLSDEFATELIDSGVSMEDAGKRVLEKLAEQQPEPINAAVRVELGDGNHEARKRVVEEALLHRLDPQNFKVTEAGKPLFGRSLIQICEFITPRYLMESDHSFAARSLSSSDFPLVLANVMEKSLEKRYQLAQKSWSRWAGKGVLRNFKSHDFLGMSDFPSMLEREEGGEYKRGQLSEKKESGSLREYGRIVGLTNRALINDDLGAFSDIMQNAALASARLDNKLMYDALQDSAHVMAETGQVLYNTTYHSNLGSAGAISETTIEEAVVDMMSQTSVGGLDKLNLSPKYLICGPSNLVAAKKALAAIQANETSSVNPFAGSLEIVLDAEIAGNDYYFAADSNEIGTISLMRLEGQEAPKVQSRVNWENDVHEFKISYAAAAVIKDYRGLYKNAGPS